MQKLNKIILFGGIGVVLVFLLVQVVVVQANWARTNKELKSAEDEHDAWNKFFNPGEDLIAKPEAEAALNQSNDKLGRQFEALKKIELGTAETLHPFSKEAAGSGDPKNYFKTMQTKLNDKAKEFGVAVPPDLGFDDKALDEGVPLNLMRLAVLDRLLVACKEAAAPQITKIKFEALREAPGGPEEEEEGQAEYGKKKEAREAKEPKAASKNELFDTLLQIPLRVVVAEPERTVERLLFALQRPSDETHGFFCILGSSVSVRVAGSGKVETVLELAALLNEKTAAKFGLQLKAPEEIRRHGPREELDLYRY
jgi:hypothetical protein